MARKIELTQRELQLLRDILCCIKNKEDWSNIGDYDIIKAHVLLDRNNDILMNINNIYDKLFV